MYIPLGRPCAMACVSGGSAAPDLFGTVKFYRARQNILVVADISGLPPSRTGIFAMHIHDGESCAGESFAMTGSHLNPAGWPHPLHAGDLPPLFSCSGNAYMSLLTDRFTLDQIYGKTLVIHADPDDFRTQPAGNAGQKIACGVICRQ